MKKDIEWLKEEVEKDIHHVFAEGDIYYVSREHILGLINDLDEPEVLSQEWISDHIIFNEKEDAEYIYADKLQNLLLPEPELPVIPKFVADWYEEHKDNLENQLRGIAFNLDKYGEMPEVIDLDKWINETESPLQTLASLKIGYEVEEEQKYYVLNNEKYFLLGKDKGHGFIFSTGGNSKLGSMERTSATFELTEQEIKGYDPRYMTFATKVEELEE